MGQSYIVLDLETTGISATEDRITEIGAVKIIDGQVVGKFEQLVNPKREISTRITEITGITNEMVADKPYIEEVLSEFIGFCEEWVIVGHNIMFDYKFLKVNALKMGHSFEKRGVDTLAIARKSLSHLQSRSLENLCAHYDIKRERGHRAYDDAYATYKLLGHLIKECEDAAMVKSLFEPKHLLYHPPKMSPITGKQKRYLSHLLELYNLELEGNMDDLTKSEASRRIDKILHKYGRKTS